MKLVEMEAPSDGLLALSIILRYTSRRMGFVLLNITRRNSLQIDIHSDG